MKNHCSQENKTQKKSLTSFVFHDLFDALLENTPRTLCRRQSMRIFEICSGFIFIYSPIIIITFKKRKKKQSFIRKWIGFFLKIQLLQFFQQTLITHSISQSNFFSFHLVLENTVSCKNVLFKIHIIYMVECTSTNKTLL